MTEMSFTQFMQLEKQRLKKCCDEIDAQFDLLTRERQTLVQIAEAIDSMQLLYDKTGQSIDDALDMREQLTHHLSDVRQAAQAQKAPAMPQPHYAEPEDQHVGWAQRTRYSSEF